MPVHDFAQIDAFASEAFRGNPACVMPMDSFAEDSVLQAIAAENNVAETAFIVPDGEGCWQLRWFTPATEVPLCGHATLASAHWLFTQGGFDGARITFRTRESGELFVQRAGEGVLEMDFPAPPVEEIKVPTELTDALGAEPVEVFRGPFIAALFKTAEDIVALDPDLVRLAGIGEVGCLALDGDGVDVTSRFFAPGVGIDEDPATGSWHCMVAAIAGPVLERAMQCYQAYPGRGAEIEVELRDDRVLLRGTCVTVIEGRFRY